MSDPVAPSISVSWSTQADEAASFGVLNRLLALPLEDLLRGQLDDGPYT